MTDLLAVPPARSEAINRLAKHLKPGLRVAISTHVNADGDGCGSEAGLARLLGGMGIKVKIVNPTPWPSTFNFLLGDDFSDESSRGAQALKDIDLLMVLDINEVSRLGQLAETVRALKVPRLVIDHHIAQADSAGDEIVADTTACATGELIYDFATTLGLEITPRVAESLYVALLTDTGGFRFANTSPRCHAVAGALLGAGVDPEDVYRHVYASVPAGRVTLLREALESLGVDAKHGLSWLSLSAGALERHAVNGEDLDGIVEHARSIAGTRLALFFRDLGHGKVKVSFRSTSEVDSNSFAGRFGGGGHVRASGALIPGTLEEVRERVLAAARALTKNGSAQ